jgi:hypothetical protein
MTRAAKIGYLVALFIGVSVGAVFGYKTTLPILDAFGESRHSIAAVALTDFSQIQCMYADPQHAKAALLTVDDLLEKMERQKTEKSLMFDLRLAYTRLALLEDQGNNPEQSHAYMTKARYRNLAVGGRDYSESELKAALTRFDDQRRSSSGVIDLHRIHV